MEIKPRRKASNAALMIIQEKYHTTWPEKRKALIYEMAQKIGVLGDCIDDWLIADSKMTNPNALKIIEIYGDEETRERFLPKIKHVQSRHHLDNGKHMSCLWLAIKRLEDVALCLENISQVVGEPKKTMSTEEYKLNG